MISKRNPFFWPCPKCGANLDYGESCDCQTKEKALSVSETFLVSIDIAPNGDMPIFIVWRKIGMVHEEVNTFTGEEALELYKKLITRTK